MTTWLSTSCLRSRRYTVRCHSDSLFEWPPLTFHVGEVRNCYEECEVLIDNLVELNIRRLGHVCFFPDELYEKL